eukprot:5103236-Heterocapsa_arctica.AAC.1
MALQLRVTKAMELNREDREAPNQNLIQKLDVAIKSLKVVAHQMGETKDVARGTPSGSGYHQPRGGSLKWSTVRAC